MGVDTKHQLKRTGKPAPASRRLSRRTAIALAALTLTAIAGLTWLLWPDPAPPQPRARTYLDFTACLLTGPQGIQDAAAAPIWAGLQDASLATRAKVQYLTVTGPQTADNAATFLASLTQSRCNLIFTAGDAPTAAASREAATYPAITFYTLDEGTDTSNHKHLPTASNDATTKNVSDILRKAVATGSN